MVFLRENLLLSLVFDVKPYLDKGIFSELKDMKVFNSVRPFLGSIQWKDGQDFCPDTLYMDSIIIADNISIVS